MIILLIHTKLLIKILSNEKILLNLNGKFDIIF